MAPSIAESDPVSEGDVLVLVVDVEIHQLFELSVDDLELVGDKHLAQEDIIILDHIVEPVDVCSDGSPHLPVSALLQVPDEVGILVDVGELTDVDVVLALHQH